MVIVTGGAGKHSPSSDLRRTRSVTRKIIE